MTEPENLALEKLRAELRKLNEDLQTEFARRHNWAQQEEFWRAQMSEDMQSEYARRHNWAQQEEFWRAQERKDMQTEDARRHNWAQQEEFWRAQERVSRWQTWLLFGTFVLGVLGIVSRVLWP